MSSSELQLPDYLRPRCVVVVLLSAEKENRKKNHCAVASSDLTVLIIDTFNQ